MVYICVAAAVATEVPAVEVTLELVTELKAQVKIRQPKELKVLLIAVYY